jgi:DNA gyrase/topoisomerase IV subunit B
MSDEILSLDAIDHVRIRPGMYIGGTNKRALHNLIDYLLEEITTDILLDRCNRVEITLQAENWICIRDNGPGLPLDQVERLNKTMLEVLLSHGGVDRDLDGEYKYKGGLYHGIRLYCINALSSEFHVEVARSGYLRRQAYQEGRPQTELTQLRKLQAHESTGTTFTFKPDIKIFDQIRVDYKFLQKRLFELAMLLKKVTFTLRDERSEPYKEQVFHFENGLTDYVNDLRGDATPLHPIIHRQYKYPTQDYRGDTIVVEFAFQYVDDADTSVLSFVNTKPTASGNHVIGFYSGLSKVLSEIAFTEGWHSRKNGRLVNKKVGKGLRAVIHITHPSPQFESQTKPNLINADIENLVEQSVYAAFSYFKSQHSDIVKRIAERCAKGENPNSAE